MEKPLIAQAANPSLTPQGTPVGGTPVMSARPTYYVERTTSTVTLRAFVLGVLLSVVVAWLNCYELTGYNVSTVGGIQMPFGAIFMLLLLVVVVNPALRRLREAMLGVTLLAALWVGWLKYREITGVSASETTHRALVNLAIIMAVVIGLYFILRRLRVILSAVELMTVYAMLMFAGLVSTSGCDNQFMTMGPGLFYFQTPENSWAKLFYKYVPWWFSPGWDGRGNVDKSVIESLFLGGKSLADIPWTAWIPTLTGWGIFLLLTYAVLFFVALIFRKQWIEREALAFPLVQLPLQMAEADKTGRTVTDSAFWTNRMMWIGFVLAASVHFLNGMHTYYPDWPTFPVNNWGGVLINFPDKPWSAFGYAWCKLMLGGIGIAYLLTSEVSFSFWFFYLVMMCESVLAEMLGFPTAGMPKAGIASKPTFIIYQSVGGWVMLAGFLVWGARHYIAQLVRSAFSDNATDTDEPFSSRFMIVGFLLSMVGLFAWSAFAGINLIMAFVFFGIFLITTIVLTRLVIEGGFIFPQAPYYPLEWMMTATPGLSAKVIGAQSLTALSFVQPTILLDMRTCVLPAFLHVMKIADELKLDRRGLRRMLLCSACAIVVTLLVTFVTTLHVLYTVGGLQGYTWFTKGAPEAVLNTAATAIKTEPSFSMSNGIWMVAGAAVVWLLTIARGRFLWFPLHPLGYLAAPAYPISQLWFSFFVGWLVKSIVMKYGGSDSYTKLRPFFIGLILGNLFAMVLWMIVGFMTGTQIGFWCA